MSTTAAKAKAGARKLNTRTNADLHADTFSGNDAEDYVRGELQRNEDGIETYPWTLSVSFMESRALGATFEHTAESLTLPGKHLDDLIAVLESLRAQRDGMGMMS